MAASTMPEEFQSYDYYREQYLALLRQQGQSPSQQENWRPSVASAQSSPERPALQKSSTSPAKGRSPAARQLPAVPQMARAMTATHAPVAQYQHYGAQGSGQSSSPSRQPLQPQLNWDNSQQKPSMLRKLTPRVNLKRSESDATHTRLPSGSELGPDAMDAVTSGRANTMRAPRRSNLPAGPEARDIAPPARYQAYEESSRSLDHQLHPLTPRLDPLYNDASAAARGMPVAAATIAGPSSPLAPAERLADFRAPHVYANPGKAVDQHKPAPTIVKPVAKRGVTMKLLQSMTGKNASSTPSNKAAQGKTTSSSSAAAAGTSSAASLSVLPAVTLTSGKTRSPRSSGGSATSSSTTTAPVQLQVGETSLSLPVVALGAVGIIVGGLILRAILTFSQSILRFVVFCIFVAAGYALSQYSNQVQQQQQRQQVQAQAQQGRRRVS